MTELLSEVIRIRVTSSHAARLPKHIPKNVGLSDPSRFTQT